MSASACPACGQAGPPGKKFCTACGSRLAGPTPPPMPPALPVAPPALPVGPRKAWLKLAGAGVLGGTVLFVILFLLHGPERSGTSASSSGNPDTEVHDAAVSRLPASRSWPIDQRMQEFFANEKPPAVPALTQADLEALAGTWEAKYVSFNVDGIPLDLEALPKFRLLIARSGSGMAMRQETGNVERALALDGPSIRVARREATPDLVLRREGPELIGEISMTNGKSSLRAEFRGVRQ